MILVVMVTVQTFMAIVVKMLQCVCMEDLAGAMRVLILLSVFAKTDTQESFVKHPLQGNNVNHSGVFYAFKLLENTENQCNFKHKHYKILGMCGVFYLLNM